MPSSRWGLGPPLPTGSRREEADRDAAAGAGSRGKVPGGLESRRGISPRGSKALSGAGTAAVPSGARDPGSGHGRPWIRQSRGREAGIMQGERKYLWTIHTLNVTSSWFDKTWERRSEICQLHRDPGSSLQGTALVPNYPCYANLLPKRPASSCAWGLRGPHLLPVLRSP